MAHNGHGLAMCRHLKNVKPGTKAQSATRRTDDEDKNKSSTELPLTESRNLGTDSEQKDEDLFVCQHSSKPNVTCWALQG